jgi:hypothetical protein
MAVIGWNEASILGLIRQCSKKQRIFSNDKNKTKNALGCQGEHNQKER